MRLRLKSLGILFGSKIKKIWQMTKYWLLDVKLLFLITIATMSNRKFFHQYFFTCYIDCNLRKSFFGDGT